MAASNETHSKERVPWDCLGAMRVKTPLLKFRRRGDPHFREFVLSDDMRTLAWYSPSKATADTEMELQHCVLKVGDDVTRRDQRERFRETAFSLVHVRSGKSLDAACKDRKEFRVWETGLRYLTLFGPPDMALRSKALPTGGARMGRTRREPSLEDAATPSPRDASPSRRLVSVKELRAKIKDASDAYSWGAGGWGQLGHGTEGSQPVPHCVQTLLGKGVEQVACGAQHTAVLTESGDVFMFGHGGNGRLGTGSTRHHMAPVQLFKPGPGKEPWIFAQVSCGDFHSAGVTEGGELFTWGCGIMGQLGHADTYDRLLPTAVAVLHKKFVRLVAAGHAVTAAVTEDWQLYTFGSGECGRLGHGDDVDRLVPTPVAALEGKPVLDVALGDHHSLVLVEPASVYAWGWGATGALGQGNTADAWSPTLVEALQGKSVCSISAGAAHSVALTGMDSGFAVFTWGDNSRGQLGLTAADVSSLRARTAMRFRASLSRASAEDKQHDADAGTDAADLPDGAPLSSPAAPAVAAANADATHVLLPCAVSTLAGKAVTDIACGAFFTAAVIEHKSLYIWGDASAQQLGGKHTDGFAPQPRLVEALSDKEVRRVACGAQHVCAKVATQWIRDDETTSCMRCKTTFTMMIRRHHCRNCGGVFCGTCTKHRISLLKLGHIEPVRVCDSCFDSLKAGS